MPGYRIQPIFHHFKRFERLAFPNLLASLLGLCACITCTSSTNPQKSELQLNFRPESASKEKTNFAVTPSTSWQGQAKSHAAGWLEHDGIKARVREGIKEPLASFVFALHAKTLRVMAPKGWVAFEIEVGDMAYADKTLLVSIPSVPSLHLSPIDRLSVGEFARLRWTMEVSEPFVDVVFSAPRGKTWAISSMAMHSTPSRTEPELSRFRPRPVVGPSTWQQTAALGDPNLAIRNDGECKPLDAGKALQKSEYIELISNIVDEYRKHQHSDGRILDPYEKREIQYATPAYAFAAATVASATGRPDLKASALLSLKESVEQLRNRQAPDQHEDFYPLFIAHALERLNDAPHQRSIKSLKDQLASLDPWSLYTTPPGSGNWNVAALAGEHQLYNMSVRSDATFWQDSLSLQSAHMNNKFGHYLSEENSTAYDVFPRVWIGDVLSSGLNGPDADAIAQVWDRAAWMTLLSQSPSGELPSGGRSSSMLWNDAALCALFENAANRAFRSGNKERAGLYRAAAHLALASIRTWMHSKPSIPIVKNRIDLPNRHGLEPYAHASNYALLSAALLALGHRYFNDGVAESCPLAHTGSFVVDMTPTLEKIIANHHGAYLVINTRPRDSNDPIGLVRIDFKSVDPSVLIPEGLRKSAPYHLPSGSSGINAGVSIQWRKPSGTWTGLSSAYSVKTRSKAHPKTTVSVDGVRVNKKELSFTIAYRNLNDGMSVFESYAISPTKMRIHSRVQKSGVHNLRFAAPLLSNDGISHAKIEPTKAGCIEVSTPNSHHRFHRVRWCSNAGPLTISRAQYPYRSGWAQLLTSQELPSSQPIWLEMTVMVP